MFRRQEEVVAAMDRAQKWLIAGVNHPAHWPHCQEQALSQLRYVIAALETPGAYIAGAWIREQEPFL